LKASPLIKIARARTKCTKKKLSRACYPSCIVNTTYKDTGLMLGRLSRKFSTPHGFEHGFTDKKGAIVSRHLSQRIIKNAVSSQTEKVPFQV
jgi:hypothetical protein